jgi:Mlc titration factor MtfA (ptsG expression regulator)
MDEIVLIFFTLFLLGFVLWVFGMLIISFLDDLSIYLFNKPLYIHLYFRPRKVTQEMEYILQQKFRFYLGLSAKEKTYFQHRVACFLEKYQFISRENLVVTKEMEVLIAATYVMLTFGMRRYLFDSFDKIIIYPEAYLSTQSQEYYKGEFNPRMKAVAFSWKDFIEGYEIDNDNLNLGIHEFSHVVHHHSMQNNDASSLTFKKYYAQLHKEVTFASNRQMLIDSEYFRIYAYTNQYEFISVIIEHYFETPLEFRTKFPQLFQNVSRMLNHKH